MVEFVISNEIFLGMMMLLIVPTILYLNKIMNKLNNLLICFQTQKVDCDHHKEHSNVMEEKFNTLNQLVTSHSIMIGKLEDDVSELKSKHLPK